MPHENLFKIVFSHQGDVWEIYARKIGSSDLFGFVEVEEITFGERSQVVIDPSEEKIKSELKDVRRLFLPMHAVLRIDEVDRQGSARIRGSEKRAGSVSPFPVPIVPKPPSGGE